MKSPLEILNTAMKATGPWHGLNGSLNHRAYDVLFAAEQHLRQAVDKRAERWLQERTTGSEVPWLEGATGYPSQREWLAVPLCGKDTGFSSRLCVLQSGHTGKCDWKPRAAKALGVI